MAWSEFSRTRPPSSQLASENVPRPDCISDGHVMEYAANSARRSLVGFKSADILRMDHHLGCWHCYYGRYFSFGAAYHAGWINWTAETRAAIRTVPHARSARKTPATSRWRIDRWSSCDELLWNQPERYAAKVTRNILKRRRRKRKIIAHQSVVKMSGTEGSDDIRCEYG